MLYEFKERVTFKRAKEILGDFRENFLDQSFFLTRSFLTMKPIEKEMTNGNNNADNHAKEEKKSVSKGFLLKNLIRLEKNNSVNKKKRSKSKKEHKKNKKHK